MTTIRRFENKTQLALANTYLSWWEKKCLGGITCDSVGRSCTRWAAEAMENIS